MLYTGSGMIECGRHELLHAKRSGKPDRLALATVA